MNLEDEEESKARRGDRSATDKERNKFRDSFADSTSSLTSDTAPEMTKDGDQPQEDLRTHDQLCKEITVMPNSFIPLVNNVNFEFVPFDSKLQDDDNPIVRMIDLNHLS